MANKPLVNVVYQAHSTMEICGYAVNLRNGVMTHKETGKQWRSLTMEIKDTKEDVPAFTRILRAIGCVPINGGCLWNDGQTGRIMLNYQENHWYLSIVFVPEGDWDLFTSKKETRRPDGGHEGAHMWN